MIEFTKQDLLTFGLGLATAIALEVAIRVKDLDPTGPIDWERLGYGLLVGSVSAAGRYLFTRLSERVVSGS